MVAVNYVLGLLASCSFILATEPVQEKAAAHTFENEKVGLLGPHKPRYCRNCKQVWCDLTICFNDHEGPNNVVNDAMSSKVSNYNDKGALTSWSRTSGYCNNGLRQATGVYKVWRVPCNTNPYDINADYAGAKGKVQARCHDHTEVEVSHC